MKTVIAFILTFLIAVPVWADSTVHHNVKVKINPSASTIQVEDLISLTGQGEITFTLSPDFKIKRLRVDGRAQGVMRKDGGIVINLKSAGDHEILLMTAADLKDQRQPPFLNKEGGYLNPDWLAHPKGHLATWDIVGRTSADQKWLTPGRLISEEQTDARYVAQFSNDQARTPPILITGPFTVSERWTNDIRVRTYFHPELAPLAEGYLDDTVRYIEEGIQNIGPYPYSEFSVVSGVAPVGWGLPGLTYMGRRVLALPFIRSTSLPHEILHNWWGNAVDVDYTTGNWAEGLTTFQADLVQSALKNNDGGTSKRLEWLRNYAALPQGQDIALSQFTSRSHDALQVVGYGKTAFVFHMLKIHLGEEAFNSALKRFYQMNKFQTASWADLQSALETASGKDLADFFKAWILKPGAPELSLLNAQANGFEVSFTLAQSQLYPLDIPVQVQTKNGKETFQVRLNQKEQTFTLRAKDTITGLLIDPNYDVFRRLQTSEMPPIFRDVTLNPNTQLVVQGGDQAVNTLALALAERLLQRPVNVQKSPDDEYPRIAIALNPKAASDGRAYVERDEMGRVTLFITAKTVENLAKMGRVLPHYKRRSFVTFQDGRVVDKGVAKAKESPLMRTFGNTPE